MHAVNFKSPNKPLEITDIKRMSSEEMESKLKNVLKENSDLRVIIKQNNATLLQQYQTMLKWQETVKEADEKNVQNLENTKDFINKLQTSNEALKNRLARRESESSRGNPLNSENVSQDKSNSASQNPKSEPLPDMANISVEEAESAMQFERERSMRVKLEKIEEELKQVKQTIQIQPEHLPNPDLSTLLRNSPPRSLSPSMSWDCSDFIYENSLGSIGNSTASPSRRKTAKHQERDHDEIDSTISIQDFHPGNDDQNKVKYLTQLLIEEKNKVSDMQQLLENKPNLSNEQYASIDIQSQHLIKELKTSEERFVAANEYLQKYKEKCKSLQNWLTVYQGELESMVNKDNTTIDQLKSDMVKIKETLKIEQQAKIDEQKNLLGAQEQFKSLLKDYEELMELLKRIQKDQEDKEQQHEAFSIIHQRKMQEEIDHLTAKLVTSEEMRMFASNSVSELQKNCEALTLECENLKVQIARNNRELENIPILKSRVELFEKKCSEEKEVNSQLYDRVKYLENEVQTLKLQNRQLLDQINAYHTNMTSGIQRENNNYSPSRHLASNLYQTSRPVVTTEMQQVQPIQSASFLPTEIRESVSSIRLANGVEKNCNLYYCPKCSTAFSNYSHLVKHVDACLNQTH